MLNSKRGTMGPYANDGEDVLGGATKTLFDAEDNSIH